MDFKVDEDFDGISVKNFLRNHCSVSARLLAKLKRTENGVTRNGKLIKSIDILRAGDVVTISVPNDKNEVEPVNIPVDVVYEDDTVILFNKPPYMPVHPVHNHRLDTLANAAAYYSQKAGEYYVFRAVNRLDRNTSGLVLCAKNSYAVNFLAKNTEKVYTALCEGILKGNGTIDMPLRLKEGHTIQREIGEGGVRAITHYKAIVSRFNHTLVECILETGRTHQIRTHFSGIGHPLAGDDMYGGSTEYFKRQCLHCSKIDFLHPKTHKTMTVVCKPDDWIGELQNNFLQTGS